MDLTIRGSEYSDFLNCRKKWYHAWIEGIEPKRPDKKLFVGTLFHKWLEHYYNNGCNKLLTDLQTSTWLNEQDTTDMDPIEMQEIIQLTKGMAEYYDKTYGESDSQFNVLGTEVEFIVLLQEGIYMTGTIDLVYEVDGKVRFMDHKTVSSLQMYEDKSRMDRQISRYWWALQAISKGIGRIKDKETGLWKRWNEFIGKEVDGFDYNLIAKDFPKEPKVLKSGKLSTDKNQKVTFESYMYKIRELGLRYADYDDVLNYLADKPNQFTRRIDVKRTQSELESAAWEFLYTAGDIHDIQLTITENPKPDIIEALTYRNIGNQCHTMCQFKTLCQTAIEGGNISLTKNLGYRKKEEK